jgi:hypothetical protein
MTDDNLALKPVKINFSPGPEYSEKSRKWQGIPGIERAPNGRLWATWYTGGRAEDENNHVVLTTSSDDSLTWSEPLLVIDPPGDIRASDPVLWHDPRGCLWLFWMQTAHCGMTFDGCGGVWAITCTNSGSPSPSWSSPRRIANGIMMNKPTVLSSSEWLLPCAVWSHRGPWKISLPEEQYSNVIVSRDQGETFERLGYADVPKRACDEHMIVERRDGTLWMLVRRKDGIGEAISYDRGQTWKASPQVVLPGPNARFHIRRLKSGRLLLINHYGFNGRSHLTALLSDDDGATWPHRLLLDERDSVSYPDAIETPEGRILVIYDRKRVGEGEIIMQTFTEDDVLLNRAPGYESGRLRMISHVHRTDIGSQRILFSNDFLIDRKTNVALKKHSGTRRNCDSSISMNANGTGELLIEPVWFKGAALSLDYASSKVGSIRVELQDWIGLPIKGYTLDDCLEISGDASDHRVRWAHGENVKPLEGQLIRMRFVMRKADLFSLRFEPAVAELASSLAYSERPLLGRRLYVTDEPGSSLASLRKIMHGDTGYETDFVMSNAPVSPKNQTRFMVRRQGSKLLICALLHICNRDSRKGPAGSPYHGAITLSFSQKGDSTGFVNIGFAEGMPPSYSSFLPCPEAKSTLYPLLRPTSWEFEHFVNNPGSIFESEEVLFHALFEEKEIFAFNDAVGFNISRADSDASEGSSWSFTTAMNCDGMLLRSSEVKFPVPQAPSVSPAKTLAIGLTNDPLMVMTLRPYTPAGFDGEMRALKKWGLNRYHWIDNTGLEAMLPCYPSMRDSHYTRSLKNCGELLPAACKAAHRHKLDIVADVKLYDLSWLAEPSEKHRGHDKVFDGAVFLPMPDLKDKDDAFMKANPAWIRRAKFPITALRLYSLDPIPAIKLSDISLFESDDNMNYHPLRLAGAKIAVRKTARSNRRWAPDGIHPDKGTTASWMLELSGIKITKPFLAFEAAKTDATLLNRNFAIVEAVSADGTEAPFIIGNQVHATTGSPGKQVEGIGRRFSFSSAMGGWLNLDESAVAIRRWPLKHLGLSFVEPETMPGLLEPTHPEAVQVWLERIDFCLKSGVDGVSLRSLRHHNGCPSWTQYSYAPTVLKQFEKLFGRAVEATDEDIVRVREIRGEAFGKFLAEASRRVKAKGKRFIFQMEVVGGPLNAVNSRMGMNFNIEKWIADGLFDEIYMKIISGHSPWVRTVLLPFARKHGVKIQLITANVSAGYGHTDYRINERIVSDAVALGYDGVNFYESANLYELTESAAIQPRGMGKACIARAAEIIRKI